MAVSSLTPITTRVTKKLRGLWGRRTRLPPLAWRYQPLVRSSNLTRRASACRGQSRRRCIPCCTPDLRASKSSCRTRISWSRETQFPPWSKLPLCSRKGSASRYTSTQDLGSLAVNTRTRSTRRSSQSTRSPSQRSVTATILRMTWRTCLLESMTCVRLRRKSRSSKRNSWRSWKKTSYTRYEKAKSPLQAPIKSTRPIAKVSLASSSRRYRLHNQNEMNCTVKQSE